MPDTAKHMDTDTGQAALSTALSERLLQRRTEPLGVIDVRQPQQHYARTSGWVAQRFALLEHWQTRYGSGADTAAAHANLASAIPGQPMAEPPHVLASPTQLARTVTQADAPQPPAGLVASSAPPEHFQIRRRGTAPVASPQTVAVPHGGSHAAAPAERDTATARSSVRSASARRSGNSEAMATPQAERGELRAADNPALTRQATPVPTTLMAPKLPAMTVSRVGTIPTSLPSPLQRKASTAAPELARAQALTIPAISGPIAPLPWPQSSASPGYESPSLAGGEDAAGEVTHTIAAQARPAGAVAALATAASPASSPLLQRQPGGSARAAAIAPGDAVERPAATDAEIRPPLAGVSQPSVVWRQVTAGSSPRSAVATAGTSGARSSLPLAISTVRSGEGQVARQATPTESAASPSAERPVPPPAPPAHTTPPATTIDIAQLADQVSELLGRRLEIERERRGMTGWH